MADGHVVPLRPGIESMTKEEVCDLHARDKYEWLRQDARTVCGVLQALGVPHSIVERFAGGRRALISMVELHVLRDMVNCQDEELRRHAERLGFEAHPGCDDRLIPVYRLVAGGFCYIGVAVDPLARWASHYRDMMSGAHPATLMSDYVRAGHEMVAEVIDRAPADRVLALEQAYIDAVERVGYSVANSQRRAVDFEVGVLAQGVDPCDLAVASRYIDRCRAQYILSGPYRLRKRFGAA